MEVVHPHCAGLDVHKDSVVACVRHMVDGTVKREVRSFQTTTQGLLALSEWLSAEGCTHVVMEATGVYWKPVWHILSDGEFLASDSDHLDEPLQRLDVEPCGRLRCRPERSLHRARRTAQGVREGIDHCIGERRGTRIRDPAHRRVILPD